MSEKLCIFCKHFNWSAEEMWGMGSTMTGPMFEGGDGCCNKGHFNFDYIAHPKKYISTRPKDEEQFRDLILTGENCQDYEQVKV